MAASGYALRRGRRPEAGVLRAAVLLLAVSGVGAAAGDAVPLPEWPEPRARVSASEGCVEPLAVMRREHMNLLFAQRDATVRHGIRERRHRLARCVACHAGRDAEGQFIAVDAPGQFCASCHVYAAVDIDCFECHASRPAQDRNDRPRARDDPDKPLAMQTGRAR